jgi:hypothetical protein
MARKKKGAIISFEVTDDGTLKQVGRRAKTASKDIAGVGKSAGDTRRNLQSMSGRTESASKSFSRLQQGTGGLVQSYAILASTVFAVTAAFRALENAQNIQQQIKGFETLTKVTGTSLLTITNRVREATNGLLDFQTAAQQTAIATAAGFSADQIEGLAEGAKRASVALGRDMTDSFNRLIRGVTKAEPELLDELGIILRLDIATRNYAASIGASADKLTIAQRRAAVYNEVNKQLESNFGAIGDDANSLTNQITAFTTSLGDIGIAISGTILPAINTFISFLDRNKPILFGVLTIFALRLTNDIMPGLKGVGVATQNWVNSSKSRITELNTQLDGNSKKYKKLGIEQNATTAKVSKAFRQSLKKRGMSEDEFFKVKSPANQKRSISAHINALRKIEKATGKSMKRQIAIQDAAYKKIVAMSNITGKKVGIGLSSGLLQAEKGLIRIKLIGQNAMAKLAQGAMKAGPVFAALGGIINAAFSVFMFLSIATMFYDMLPGVAKAKEAVQDLKDKLEDSESAAGELNNAIAGFNIEKLKSIGDSIREGVEPMMQMAKAVDHLANILKTADIKEMGTKLVETVESSIVDGGRKTEKASVPLAVMEMIRASQMGIAAGGGDEVQAALLAFMETASLKEDNQGEMTGYLTKEFIADRTSAIMKELTSMGSVGKDTTQYSQSLDNIREHFRMLKVDSRDFFEITEEGGKTVVNATDQFDSFFGTVDEGTAAAKSAIVSLSDMSEPLDNLMEAIKLGMPKPTAFATMSANLSQVFNQYDQAQKSIAEGKKNGADLEKLISDQLTQEERDLAKAKGFNLTIDTAAIFKMMHKLNISKKQAELILTERDLLVDINDELNRAVLMQKARKNLQTAELLLINQLGDRHSKRLAMNVKFNALQAEHLVLQGKILERTVETNGKNQAGQVVHDLTTQELMTQKEVMDAQLEVLGNQLDRFHEIRKATIETFDAAGGDALQSILEGGSGGDALKGMAEKLKKVATGSMSDMIMNPITGGFKKLLGMGPDSIKLTPEAEAIQKVHTDHVTQLEKVLTSHSNAFGHSMNISTGGTDEEGNLNSLFKGKLLSKDGYGGTSSGTGSADETLDALKDGGFKTMFQDMFGGLFDKLGGMFSGLFGGGGGGGILSTLGGFFGLERGGVIGLAKGGIARYAKGGIAKQPTYLVGEGKQNEAVVPLPDNKSIPVDLGRGANSTNNTNISVNVSDGGTTTKMEAEGASEMASAINMAVLAEIEKQQRPGGLLGV